MVMRPITLISLMCLGIIMVLTCYANFPALQPELVGGGLVRSLGGWARKTSSPPAGKRVEHIGSLRLAQLDTYPLRQLERGRSDRPFLLVGQYAKYRFHS